MPRGRFFPLWWTATDDVGSIFEKYLLVEHDINGKHTGYTGAWDVRRYGATGDGVTVDTTALQQAINAAAQMGGGRVYLAKGTYLVAPLTISSGVILEGEGIGVSTIKLAAGVGATALVTGTGVTNVGLRDLTLDVNGVNQTSQPVEGTRGVETPGSSTRIQYARVEVKNPGGAGIKVHAADQFWITDCIVSGAGAGLGAGSPGIEVGASNSTTTNGVIDNCYVTGSLQNAISIRSGGGSGVTRNVVVTNNFLKDNNTLAATKGYIAVTGPTTEAIVIANNTIWTGTELSSIGIQLQPSGSGLVVSGNAIKFGAASHTGVTIQDVVAGASRGTIVIGNTFNGNCDRGIDVSGTTPGTITENDLSGATPGNEYIRLNAPVVSGLVLGRNTGVVTGLTPPASPATGLTVNAHQDGSRITYKITATFAAFSAAGLTADATLVTLPAKAKVVSIICDVTTKFIGGAVSAATMLFGKTAGGNEYLVSFDIFTNTIRRGLADADLGTSINRASAIQGGDIPSFTATTALTARVTTVTANTNALTQGVATFYIVVELLP